MIPFKALIQGLAAMGMGILLGVGLGFLVGLVLNNPIPRTLSMLLGGSIGFVAGTAWLIQHWGTRPPH